MKRNTAFDCRPIGLGTVLCLLAICSVNVLLLRSCFPALEETSSFPVALRTALRPSVQSSGRQALKQDVLRALGDVFDTMDAPAEVVQWMATKISRRLTEQRAADAGVADPDAGAPTAAELRRALAALAREGDEGGAAPRRKGRRAAAAEADEGDDEDEEEEGEGDAVPDPTQLFSQQTCYLGGDESELCEYHNALCFDGEGPVVVVAKPVRQPPRVLDYTHTCQDNRFYEPTALPWSNCHWGFAVHRPYKPEDVRDMPNSDYSLPLSWRRWGPQNRGEAMIFREISAEEVYGKGEDALYAAEEEEEGEGSGQRERGGGKRGSRRRKPGHVRKPGPHMRPDKLLAAVDASPALPHPQIPAVSLRASYRVGNRTIDWLDGALWLSAFAGQWDGNPFHFLAKAAMLWDAQRNNATSGFGGHAGDGWVHWQPEEDIAVAQAIHPLPGSPFGTPEARSRARWVQGGSWGPLPPMDVLLFSGPGAVTLGSQNRLRPWFRGVLELATQSHTRAFFGDLASRYSDDRLLCARRGVVLGNKPRAFSGPGDGTVFRNAAYKAAGVVAKLPPNVDWATSPIRDTLGSFPRFAPRRITVLDRPSHAASGRGISNLEGVLLAAEATGLEVHLVEDMGALTFSQQVQLMASTGILIAPHGAALTNLVFLPAHAVVIELFPYGLKKLTYRNLAVGASVQYYPVYSDARLPPTATEGAASILYSRYYWSNCVAVNISAYDAIAEHACNQAAKLHDVIVPLDVFGHTLRHAVDSIGAFSLLNKEWAALAEQQGVKPPSYEEWTAGRPQELIDAQGDPRSADG